METFVLNITNLCNLRCGFCLDGDFRPRIFNLSTDEARERILRAKDSGAEVLIFMGGETLIREDAVELIALVRSLGIEPFVATNGFLLSDMDYLARLVTAGLAGIEFSYHSHLPEIADALSGRRGTAIKQAAALENLSRIQRGRPAGRALKIIVNIVISTLNLDTLARTAEHVGGALRGDGSLLLKFKAMRPIGRAGDHRSLVPRLSTLGSPLRSALDVSRRNAFPAEVETVPLCRIPEYEHLSLETRDLVLRRKYAGWNPREGPHGGLGGAENYGKPAQCRICSLDVLCAGMWKEYLRLFGAEEVSPVSTDPRRIASRILGTTGVTELGNRS